MHAMESWPFGMGNQKVRNALWTMPKNRESLSRLYGYELLSPVIHEQIQHADGWESQMKDGDSTERTFWGYIVELHDVTVKPLAEDDERIMRLPSTQ